MSSIESINLPKYAVYRRHIFIKTCQIRFFVVILPSAFQAERMFPLYIYSTTHTAKHKKDEPARIHPFLYYVLSRPPSWKPDNAALNG